MSLFDWLLVCHLVGDFLLQSDSMALNKMQQWLWLLRHIVVYMVLITVVLGVYALDHGVPAWLVVVSLLFIAGTHIVLDLRGFTLWWMRLVGVSPEHPWLAIVADQVLHIVTLAIVAQVLVLFGG